MKTTFEEIVSKVTEVSNAKKVYGKWNAGFCPELDNCRMLAATNYNEYVGKIVKIEMMPCTHRYIRVTSVTINKDNLPILHGTGFDKTLMLTESMLPESMLTESTTSFSSSDTQWTLTPDTDIKVITEEEYEEVEQNKTAKLPNFIISFD